MSGDMVSVPDVKILSTECTNSLTRIGRNTGDQCC